jgi:hypothetical protein
MTVGVEPWDTEWAYEQPVKALDWLAKNYPECSGAEGFREHDEAAAAGDREAYLEALRAYCRAGRNEALRIRQGAA